MSKFLEVKIESIANTFEWVPVHEELMEVTKMPDTVDMDHVEDIKVSPEWNEHFMDDDETSASNDIEHEINIDKKLSTVTTTTTKFLVESDKDMQRGNSLNEAGLVLSKKSKQLNLAHTRPKNVKKTNNVKSEVKTKKKVKDMSEPVKCEECGKIMKRSSLKKHKQLEKSIQSHGKLSSTMNNSSAEPIITVTLESSDMDSPVANLDAETRSLLGNGVNMPAVHKSITSSKNFWMELPQMIVVETRFITQQIATQRKIYSAQTLLPITDEQSELNNRNMSFPIATQTSPPPKLEDAASMIKPDLVDAFVSTDSPYPCRDRAQQTMKASKQMTAIGIQCNLDDDLAFVRMCRSNEESIEKKTDVKQEFLRFTREKSIFYLNGKRECMVCGQVEKNTERMLKHLALHYGPPVLCHLCGLQFEHQTLMLSHDCEMKERRSKRRRRKNQQCPIFWCGSMHRSMDALNDHIGKHLRQQRRRACVTFTLDRTVVLKRPLRTKSNYLHRCNICLRRCKNAGKFAKHRKRCVSSFMARLKEQQDIAHILILCKN